MIDPKHPLYGATKVRDLTTGETFVACNCPNQPANKTLRFVASHRERFELAQTRQLTTKYPNQEGKPQ